MNLVGTLGLGINRMLVKDIQMAQMNGTIRKTISNTIAGVENNQANRDSCRRYVENFPAATRYPSFSRWGLPY